MEIRFATKEEIEQYKKVQYTENEIDEEIRQCYEKINKLQIQKNKLGHE